MFAAWRNFKSAAARDSLFRRLMGERVRAPSAAVRICVFCSMATAWVASLAPQQVLAHDFWIQPNAFRTKAGSRMGLQFLVGERLAGERLALDAISVKRISAMSGGRPLSLSPGPGDHPAVVVNVDRPGMVVLALQNEPQYLELSAEKFNAYLREEGLETILELRTARGERDAPGRELYARCAKSLIDGGGAAGDDGMQGLTLELVALRNPYASSGSVIPFRLTFQSSPLVGALVVAINSRNPARPLAVRSDEHGRVEFRLDPVGMWMVKAVHMVPAPAGSGADWLSYWASTTFEVGAPHQTARQVIAF